MKLHNNRLVSRESVLRGALLAAVVLLAIGAVIVLATGTAEAHGNPEVSVEPNPVALGGDVTIEGEGFEEAAEVSLMLEGAPGEIPLGSATTDAEGTFSLTVTLPAAAAAGSYRIRALGPDDVAVADVRIQQAEGGTTPAPEHDTAVSFHRIGSAAEVAGFATLAGAMALIGVALLWLPGRKRHA